MSDFFRTKLLPKLSAVEGGYVNDPSDSGGETNHGITVAVARKYGYHGAMKLMPKAVAERIYEQQFWKEPGFNRVAQISERLAEELFDTGVNLGTGRAAEFLQMALNALNNGGVLYNDIAEDRDIGGKTIAALQHYLARRPGIEGVEVMVRCLDCLQGAFYIDLSRRRQKDEKYVYGWFRARIRNV